MRPPGQARAVGVVAMSVTGVQGQQLAASMRPTGQARTVAPNDGMNSGRALPSPLWGTERRAVNCHPHQKKFWIVPTLFVASLPPKLNIGIFKCYWKVAHVTRGGVGCHHWYRLARLQSHCFSIHLMFATVDMYNTTETP
eukprot:365462-Chlamydomonas_euryale.AAC.12